MVLRWIALREFKDRPHEKKLSREDAYAVLWRAASGEPLRTLANEHGVCYQSIRWIVLRENHRYLSEIHD